MLHTGTIIYNITIYGASELRVHSPPLPLALLISSGSSAACNMTPHTQQCELHMYSTVKCIM